jgi:Holliday junction DNA helicase RuvA
MIGRLRGTLAHKQPPELIVDCHGVGYELEAPMSTFYELPALGEEVTLWTHLAVREDGQTLFGFGKESERRLFRQLIRVNGVGSKMALGILSGISFEEFARCVRDQDTATLIRLPGIGRKTAERLIIEMRDRIEKDWGAAPGASPPAVRKPGESNPVSEAVDALLALGYRPNEASRMVSQVQGAAELSTEEVIRLALQGTINR